MEFIKELDRLINLLIQHRLPVEQTLFMREKDYEEAMESLKAVSTSAIEQSAYKDTNLKCDMVHYRGHKFNIISY